MSVGRRGWTTLVWGERRLCDFNKNISTCTHVWFLIARSIETTIQMRLAVTYIKTVPVITCTHVAPSWRPNTGGISRRNVRHHELNTVPRDVSCGLSARRSSSKFLDAISVFEYAHTINTDVFLSKLHTNTTANTPVLTEVCIKPARIRQTRYDDVTAGARTCTI